MSSSKRHLKVSDERVQLYLARRNQYLCAVVTDGGHEPEVDPYAFEEGDVKFTFSNKKDKTGGEREPGKKHKVRLWVQSISQALLVVTIWPIRFLTFFSSTYQIEYALVY